MHYYFNEEEDKQEFSQRRHWVRYFARATDYLTYLFLVLLFIVRLPVLRDLHQAVQGILLYLLFLFIWNFIEALLLSTWGTTLGKWLLNTSVRDKHGNKLTYRAALTRSFQVWIKGFGLGLPIVSFITFILSYYQLTGPYGKTSWDLAGSYTVQHGKLNPLGVIAVVLIIVSFILVTQ